MTRKEKARRVLDRLAVRIPRPETELDFGSEFQLLIAVILSAQCTDKRVNLVTPALFEAYPTAAAMARADADDLFPYIRSVSYPNNKARALAATARRLVDVFGGEVPRAHADLTSLAGVGRKTANVVQAVAFGEAAIAVDTHVFRVANRVGLVDAKPTPTAVEKALQRVIPRPAWADAHHLLILHGRYTCEARAPACARCPLVGQPDGPDLCAYYAELQRLPPPLEGLDPKRGRYFCKTTGRYFDTPVLHVDRRGVEQIADPVSGSMNCYDARTGQTTRRPRDYRI